MNDEKAKNGRKKIWKDKKKKESKIL